MKNPSISSEGPSKVCARQYRFDRLAAAVRCPIEQLEARTLFSASIATVASFIPWPKGTNPNPLTLDASGNAFGTTAIGGASGDGTVFEIVKGSRAITTIASFDGTDGHDPEAGVAFDSSGNLFGTTFVGGADNDGTVFEIAQGSHTITTVASFNGTNGSNPNAAVTFDSRGNLFGTTPYGGADGDGTVFEIASRSSTITAVGTFNGINGAIPAAAVTFDSRGNLFGTTEGGGADGDGTVFEIPRGSGSLATVASFDSTNGADPFAAVTFDSRGNLFGTTFFDGADGQGTVFEIARGSSAITAVASFDGTNGAYPEAAVTFDSRGNLFGTTEGGGADGQGAVFEIASGSSDVTTLASFDGTNGAYPEAAVAFDCDGDLFGTTTLGGADNDGTVFEIAKGSTSITTLASFLTTSGAYPDSAVIFDSSGDLFGTTAYGGAENDGSVFEIARGSSSLTTIASFNGTNGISPNAVTFDSRGNLFGTALEGGADGYGTVFEIAKGSSAITTIASFDGAQSFAAVTFDSNGDLFGTTVNGGASGDGVVFEIAKGSSAITTVASFNGTDGSNPGAAVTFDSRGNLFGTTLAGGADNDGTVFEIARGSSVITAVASFDGTDGESPGGAVTFDSNGNLFGTTGDGGADNDGTVFEIARGSSVITTVASFNGTDGANPQDAVTFDSKGNLFGTAYSGGADNDGTVFEIAKGTSTITTVASFDGTDGENPSGAVTFDSSGDLFGTAYFGGAAGAGTVFEIKSPV